MCLPVYRYLLDAFGYPLAGALAEEWSHGFKLLGDTPPGLGWPANLKDPKAVSWSEFKLQNTTYITEQLKHRPPDEHAEFMLKEILAERSLGRMRGPFAAPEGWPVVCVLVPEKLREERDRARPLLPPPSAARCFPAVAFSIDQTSGDGKRKIRRGEDWEERP